MWAMMSPGQEPKTGLSRAWMETQVQAYYPDQATVSSPWRRAVHSQTGTVF